MTKRRLFDDATKLGALAERLSRCPDVIRFDDKEEQQAWTLAHTFADLEESFLNILDRLMPALMAEELDPSQVTALLLDIGEELRHILYHIRDPKYYAYLLDEGGN